MLKTSAMSLFDSVDNGYAKAIINICDCHGNISCQNNLQFRVRYPGSYAADQIARKYNLHEMGTISHNVENGILIINAYLCENFNDQLSIMNGTLFDPTIFLACMYQIKDALSDHGLNDVLVSISSFSKFGFELPDLFELMNYVARSLPYNLVVTV